MEVEDRERRTDRDWRMMNGEGKMEKNGVHRSMGGIFMSKPRRVTHEELNEDVNSSVTILKLSSLEDSRCNDDLCGWASRV